MDQEIKPVLPSIDELAALMQTVIRELLQLEGSTRWAVDTIAFEGGATARHHYAGGECSLTLMKPGCDVRRIQWDTRHELPTARQIIEQVLAYARG